MKKFRKLLSLGLATAMTMAMAAPSYAASITIDNALDGETYTVYKIFDVTKADTDGDDTEDAFAYSIKGDNPWKDVVDAYTYEENDIFSYDAVVGAENKFIVNVDTTNFGTANTAAAADFADYLQRKLSDGTVTVGDEDMKSVVASDGEAVFDNLDAGYYFVATSTGILCALDTTDALDVEEKNTIPSLIKAEDKETASIGEDVTYTITVTDGRGTDKEIVIYDYMEDGLTFDQSTVEVKKNGIDIDEGNYTLDPVSGNVGDDEPYTFKITINADYVKTLEENEVITITYSAKLDADAEIYDNTNDNTAWLTYSEQTGNPSTVEVVTYQFDLVKTDENMKLLDGAEFKLYDQATEGTEIKLIKDSTSGFYRPILEGETGTNIDVENGKALIVGLKNGTYYLEEVVTPAGYNALDDRKEVTITDKNLMASFDQDDSTIYEDGGVWVKNESGVQLPSTGGIGTTIFYAAGIILMAGAVFFVVVRKKNA